MYLYACVTCQRCSSGAQAGRPVDLSIDCLQFADPDARCYHLGLADEVLHPIWRGYRRAIHSILERVAEHTCQQLRSGSRMLRMQFYCKSGRHRASAVVRLKFGSLSGNVEGERNGEGECVHSACLEVSQRLRQSVFGGERTRVRRIAGQRGESDRKVTRRLQPHTAGSVALAEIVAQCIHGLSVDGQRFEVRKHNLCAHFWPNRGCQRDAGPSCPQCFGPPSDSRQVVIGEATGFFREAVFLRLRG